MKRILIAGFGAAGYAALMAVRKTDPAAEITVIDPKEKDIFHPCGMPYALDGRAYVDKLCADMHLERMDVKRIRAELVSVIHNEKIALTNEPSLQLSFDKLIIATGGAPFIPPIDSAEKLLGRGLYTLASMTDLNAIINSLKNTSRSIVIGGGAIGAETAAALASRDGAVTLIEAKNQLFTGIFDADMAEIIKTALESQNIKVLCGTKVKRVFGEKSFAGVETENETILASIGILAAGFVSKTDPAYGVLIDDKQRTITVNTAMETSAPDIYAAGDCALCSSAIDKKPLSLKSAAIAYRQGRVAGINAAGGKTMYNGSSGTFATKIGKLEAASVGFTSALCRERGFEPVSGKIKMPVLPDYFAEAGEVFVKIIADKKTKRILGAQAVGQNAAAEINLVSLALEHGLTLNQFIETETAYCPAIGELDSALFKAADFCMRKIR